MWPSPSDPQNELCDALAATPKIVQEPTLSDEKADLVSLVLEDEAQWLYVWGNKPIVGPSLPSDLWLRNSFWKTCSQVDINQAIRL